MQNTSYIERNMKRAPQKITYFSQKYISVELLKAFELRLLSLRGLITLISRDRWEII